MKCRIDSFIFFLISLISISDWLRLMQIAYHHQFDVGGLFKVIESD